MGKKLALVFLCILLNVTSGAFGMTAPLQDCTTDSDCTEFAFLYCGGGAPGCSPKGSTSVAMFKGVSYAGKCYCLSCNGGTSHHIDMFDGVTNMVCIYDNNKCKTNTTTSTTHVVTHSKTSMSTVGIYKDMDAAVPTSTAKNLCESEPVTYSCASGYGYVYEAPSSASSTYCVKCDSQVVSTDSGKTWTAYTNPPQYNNLLVGTYYKAYNANSWTGPTGTPSSVAASNCGTSCVGSCWYVSRLVLKVGSSYWGVIPHGCSVQYAPVCNCSHTTTTLGGCVCSPNYYGTATSSSSCTQCPKICGIQSSSVAGTTSESGCCVKAGDRGEDEKGVFTVAAKSCAG